jgi:hypothetical protein
MLLEGVPRSIEESNGLIRNRTGDLLVCSIVPQSTMLPSAPLLSLIITVLLIIYNNNMNRLV